MKKWVVQQKKQWNKQAINTCKQYMLNGICRAGEHCL